MSLHLQTGLGLTLIDYTSWLFCFFSGFFFDLFFAVCGVIRTRHADISFDFLLYTRYRAGLLVYASTAKIVAH